jgi:hypothetical protein
MESSTSLDSIASLLEGKVASAVLTEVMVLSISRSALASEVSWASAS